jgi:long-chain fatty acid transport protein
MGRKSRWCILVAGLGWLFMAAGPGYGSGFALYEAGVRSTALAGAVVGRADDLSAIFYNPAGLVQLPKIQVMAGFTSFIPRAEIVTHLGPVAISNL